MKKILIIFCLFQGIFCYTSFSETNTSGKWSLLINGNYNGNFGITEAMRGSADDFIHDLSLDYNNKKYPYGDNATKTLNGGLQLAYRFNNSPIGIYFSSNINVFYLEMQILFFTDYVMMNIVSFTPGIEFCIGEPTQIWNIFGRAGINFNTIFGEVNYYSSITRVKPAFRIGIEGEFGGRFNIPSTPISLEVSALVTNVNLIGKSYNKINAIPPQDLNERELNDGKNPDNPSDINRNISFITLKGGLRIWF